MTNEETTMEWKQVIETIYVIVLMGLLIIISMVVVPAIFRDR